MTSRKAPPGGRMKLIDAKPRVIGLLQQGRSVRDAMALVGRSKKTYEQWRSVDPDFKRKVELVRELQSLDAESKRAMHTEDFVAFRERFLGMKTFPHQRQWIDMIEGRPLTDLHPSIRYEPGDENFVLINCPPEHSKSITMSVDYPTYRICKNPNERIIIVSESGTRAREFLYAIQQRLTHPRYHELQLAFAPKDGFRNASSTWRADRIYLGSELRDSSEKDPTIQALGVGQQIYGARATLILCDDMVVLGNAHHYEAQLKWVQQEVLTRLGPGGKLVVAGTRVDAIDLYRELRNGDRYPSGQSPWSYIAQPAVLTFADDPDDWETLWPRSDHPWPGLDDEPDSDGLYPRWTGQHLHRRRSLLDPRTWSMVYQQAESSEAAIFPPALVRSCVNGTRTVGLLSKTNQYHRPEGMDGLYVVCSMDPAMAGDTATIVYALDLRSHVRYVLDTSRMQAPSPGKIRDLIFAWTDKYKPQSWVIEKNAFQMFLTRDEEIRSYLASRGVIMREHYSGRNKLDPDFGVASLAPLFETKMIELPSTHNHEATKALVEQLVTWSPGMRPKDLIQDLPMALWFAELIAREVVDARTMHTKQHRDSKFIPRYRRREQNVIRIDDYLAGVEVA